MKYSFRYNLLSEDTKPASLQETIYLMLCYCSDKELIEIIDEYFPPDELDSFTLPFSGECTYGFLEVCIAKASNRHSLIQPLSERLVTYIEDIIEEKGIFRLSAYKSIIPVED